MIKYHCPLCYDADCSCSFAEVDAHIKKVTERAEKFKEKNKNATPTKLFIIDELDRKDTKSLQNLYELVQSNTKQKNLTCREKKLDWKERNILYENTNNKSNLTPYDI